MTVESRKEKSAYDYVINGKEVPIDVHIATLIRTGVKLTPHEQYMMLIKEKVSFPWPEDNLPSGLSNGKMEGGVPSQRDGEK